MPFALAWVLGIIQRNSGLQTKQPIRAHHGTRIGYQDKYLPEMNSSEQVFWFYALKAPDCAGTDDTPITLVSRRGSQ